MLAWQAERLPAYQLLGGSVHQVSAYATSGDVEFTVAHGYTAMKLSHRGSGTFGNLGEPVEQAAQGEEAAEAALASLNKRSLTDLRSFRSPPKAVVKATSATIILTAGKPKVPKDLSWAAAKKMLGNVGKFLDSLLYFDKDNVDEVLVAAVEAKFLSDPEFDPEKIRSKSGAAAAPGGDHWGQSHEPPLSGGEAGLHRNCTRGRSPRGLGAISVEGIANAKCRRIVCWIAAGQAG